MTLIIMTEPLMNNKDQKVFIYSINSWCYSRYSSINSFFLLSQILSIIFPSYILKITRTEDSNIKNSNRVYLSKVK